MFFILSIIQRWCPHGNCRKRAFLFLPQLVAVSHFYFPPQLVAVLYQAENKKNTISSYTKGCSEEKPLISGKFVFRSWDNCSMMPSPHFASAFNRTISPPILQYSFNNSVFTFIRCLNLTLADTLFQFAYPLFIFVVCLYQFTHGAILLLIAYKDKSFFSDNLPNRIFFCSPYRKKLACQKCLILLTGSLYNRNYVVGGSAYAFTRLT